MSSNLYHIESVISFLDGDMRVLKAGKVTFCAEKVCSCKISTLNTTFSKKSNHIGVISGTIFGKDLSRNFSLFLKKEIFCFPICIILRVWYLFWMAACVYWKRVRLLFARKKFVRVKFQLSIRLFQKNYNHIGVISGTIFGKDLSRNFRCFWKRRSFVFQFVSYWEYDIFFGWRHACIESG